MEPACHAETASHERNHRVEENNIHEQVFYFSEKRAIQLKTHNAPMFGVGDLTKAGRRSSATCSGQNISKKSCLPEKNR